MNKPISRLQVGQQLERHGFRLIATGTKLERYLHVDYPRFLYVKQGEKNPLVIDPAHEHHLSDLLAIAGVFSDADPRYLNSNLGAFPFWKKNGESRARYGLDFGFESPVALDQFLRVLLGLQSVPSAEDDIAFAEDLPDDPTEREAVVAARRGQGKYRRDLFARWGGCAITGCTHPRLLRASHILPWRMSSNVERLSADNGLLLSAGLDAAFDSGLISFDDEGCIVISDRLSEADAAAIGIHDGLRLRGISAGNAKYLARHREIYGFARLTEEESA